MCVLLSGRPIVFVDPECFLTALHVSSVSPTARLTFTVIMKGTWKGMFGQ